MSSIVSGEVSQNAKSRKRELMRMAKHNERCRGCKDAIANLLAATFGQIEINYDIDLPARLEDYYETSIYADLAPIYKALQSNRGFDEFVKAKRLPRVDFFIPAKMLIVEFDESQHFTKPRDITLSLYPNKREFGFPVNRWRSLCQSLNKRDNSPPFRDEQRAWYDTIRDFAPFFWKTGNTVRLFSSDIVWCSLDPKAESDIDKFKKLITNSAIWSQT